MTEPEVYWFVMGISSILGLGLIIMTVFIGLKEHHKSMMEFYNRNTTDTTTMTPSLELQLEMAQEIISDLNDSVRELKNTTMSKIEIAYKTGWSDGVTDEGNGVIHYSPAKQEERWANYKDSLNV